jgi:CopA family copper-resistance protein
MPNCDHLNPATSSTVTRRRFVQGAVALTAMSRLAGNLLARMPAQPTVLTGDTFHLVIDSNPVNFTGKSSRATSVNGLVPGPTLKWKEGDTVTLSVTNRLPEATSIHWHGIRSPAGMDGVPGLSFRGILPGETFVYKIPVRQNGSYWYHSHSRFQEQTGLYGSLIIEPREKDPIEFDREYAVVLSDWTDQNPETVFGNLKKQSDYYNFQKRTAGTFFRDVKNKGLASIVSNRLMWGRMNMTPTDISDVTGSTYTYLINGKPPSENWTAIFAPGQRIRLRFVNAAAMTFFDIRIPGLQMTVVAADGNPVQPVTVDEFRMGVAETYDVIVEPKGDAAYTLFVQPEARDGFARGTIAPRLGMTAPVPATDPMPMRTMTDMGMAGMGKGGAMGKASGMGGMAGMGDINGKDSGGSHQMMPMPRAADASASSSAFGATPFPQPGPLTSRMMPPPGYVPPHPAVEPNPHRSLRMGPMVDNVAMQATTRLDKPGDGLTGNGRRVLTYGDLKAVYRGVDGREPSRDIELHLSGSMDRYIWGFDGQKFSSAEPLHMALGERVRIILVNDTMMEHPIHLHGLWSELENGNGDHLPYKHTIIVKPGERVSYLVSADTPGRWAYHCHLLYHMDAGMFQTVIVS